MHPAKFLAALQLADSALPIGRFAHSYGLEALLTANPSIGEDGLVELVASVLLESVGPVDGVAVIHARRAETPEELFELDRKVTARRLTPPARLASRACGRQLAALASLLTEAEPAAAYCTAARRDETDGNLPVVEGALAAALGIPEEPAVLLSLRGTATALLSATVRLGRLSARRSQAALKRLEPTLIETTELAFSLEAGEIRSTLPELEIHSLLHRRSEARLFMT